MNKLSLVMMSLLMLAMVVILAPNIFAMNRGKILRNVAIWLAVILVLGLVYQNFGSLLGANKNAALVPAPIVLHNEANKPDTDKSNGNQDFIPPRD